MKHAYLAALSAARLLPSIHSGRYVECPPDDGDHHAF